MSGHAYTEDQLVEQPAIGLFAELGWATVSALEEMFGAPSPGLAATLSHPMGEGAPLGRETKGEVVLVSRLRAALERLNPALPPEAIAAAVDELTRDRSAMSLEAANREVYLLLKEGIKVSVPDTGDSTPHPGPLLGRSGEGGGAQRSAHPTSRLEVGGQRTARPTSGGQKTERLRVVDWEHPADNDFLLVSQLSVTGALYTCRPDLVGFVNGLPLVVIELKKPGVPARAAFDDVLEAQRWNHGLVRISSKHSGSVISLPNNIHWSLCRRAQMFQESGLKYPSRAKTLSKNGERAFGPGQAYLAINWR